MEQEPDLGAPSVTVVEDVDGPSTLEAVLTMLGVVNQSLGTLRSVIQSERNWRRVLSLIGALFIIISGFLFWRIEDARRDGDVKTCQAINANRTTLRLVLQAAEPPNQTPEDRKRTEEFYIRIGANLALLDCNR